MYLPPPNMPAGAAAGALSNRPPDCAEMNSKTNKPIRTHSLELGVVKKIDILPGAGAPNIPPADFAPNAPGAAAGAPKGAAAGASLNRNS